MNIIYLKKFFANLFILAIITTIFVNTVHKYYQNTFLDEESNISIDEKNTSLKNRNFKTSISKYISSEEAYEKYTDRNCEVTGSMEDRKKTRWVFKSLMYKIYEFLFNKNILLPYYFQILFFSALIFLTFFITFKTFPIKNEYKYLFLFFIAFVFQNRIGEFQFSIFEMFFLSLALFASKTKNFMVFLISVLLATLNRESGILISFTWFIFNYDLKKFIYILGLTSITFILINFDIISCLINPKFLIPIENQEGQFNFSEIGNSINYLSALKVLLVNFIIPFGFSFYVYFTTEKKNKIILYILLIYLITFLVAVPPEHISSRLILLPILISLIYFKSRNEVGKTR